MTNDNAAVYKKRITAQIDQMQTRIADMKLALAALENPTLLPYIDEDKIVRAVGGNREPVDQPQPQTQPVNGANHYRMPNRGLRAQILRALTTGPTYIVDLQKVVTASSEAAFHQAIEAALGNGLIAKSNSGILSLTDTGMVQGRWLADNPAFKLYCPNHHSRRTS